MPVGTEMRTQEELTPEIRLIVAMLKRCSKDLRSKDQQAQRQARVWAKSNATHPGSFLWCCNAIKYSSAKARRLWDVGGIE